MENIGSITKQLLNNNKIQEIKNNSKQVYENVKDNSKQVYENSKQVYENVKDNSKQVYDNDMIDVNFGDISEIQIPYEIIPDQVNYSEKHYYMEDESHEENFCSYILYFIIILICLGYIGYNLGSEKVISVESMNGITMGLLTGMIIVDLLWSSIKNN